MKNKIHLLFQMNQNTILEHLPVLTNINICKYSAIWTSISVLGMFFLPLFEHFSEFVVVVLSSASLKVLLILIFGLFMSQMHVRTH